MGLIKVDSLDDARLAVYARLTDRQLRSRLEASEGVLIAESEKVVRTALAAGLEPLSLLVEEGRLAGVEGLVRELAGRAGADVRERAGHLSLEPAQGQGVPVYVLDHGQISRLVGYNVTRGVLCALRRPAERQAAEVLDKLDGARRVAVLEGVTDATNVGAAFRSAAALGVDAVLITPSCCDPYVRRAVRVSMGTVFQIPWGRFASWAGEGVELLRRRGFATVALALRDDAVELGDARLAGLSRMALVFGTEGDGLAAATIEACDCCVRIPMQHGVDSLNVAAASAVAFWELRDRAKCP